MIRQFSYRIMLLWGWQRHLLAFACGFMAAFALPPYGVFPLLALCFPLLIWLIDGAGAAGGRVASAKHAAFIGWLFGFGFFLNGLWWVGKAFLVQADKFAWAMPFAVLLLPAGLALFYALAAFVARLFWGKGLVRVLSFCLAFLMAELLRSVLFTGFPWNLFGVALAQTLPIAQILSVIGIYGLTLITLLIFSSFVLFEEKATWKFPILSVFLLIAMFLFGAWRLNEIPTTFVKDIRLRLMQPNVPQDEKFNASRRDDILKHYLTLSDKAVSDKRSGLSDITHLIWPESAFPFFLVQDKAALIQLGEALPANVTLITGAARVDLSQGRDKAKYYNSVYVINDKGELVETYDKINLVPFGEFLPFQPLLEKIGLQQLTRLAGGFSAGNKRILFTKANAPPLTPLICYEVIFSGSLLAAQTRPQWLLNLTNDAWFGLTPGPYQHFHQAQMRAIEEGVPLVRVANNGISGVIDPLGRVVTQLPLNETNILDSALPQAIAAPLYAKYRTFPLIFLLSMIFLLWIILYTRTLKRK